MDPQNTGDDKMGLFLNDDLLKLALERIRVEEPEGLVEFGLSHSKLSFAISRNDSELISLKEVTYNGVTYYVGLPK